MLHEDRREKIPSVSFIRLLVVSVPAYRAGSTREMVKIMQENGEVVVVLGSSANYHNIQTFLTADASLSVEPLYPQVGGHANYIGRLVRYFDAQLLHFTWNFFLSVHLKN